MTVIQQLVDGYAEEVEYTAHAEKFLELEHWTGNNSLLLLADAAGTTTGQNYFAHVKPSVESFEKQFLDSGQIKSFVELAKLDKLIRGMYLAMRI